jgi:hypothetical protein
MIHRDNRRSYEASSALNQIIHREGPAELTVGDIDTYAEKWIGDTAILRLLEHKQPDQPLGRAQARVLKDFDLVIRAAVTRPTDGVRLDERSGVYLVRGLLRAEDSGRRKVNFSGPQVVERLDGTPVLQPTSRVELWDWLNGGQGWTSRDNRGRWWR